MSGLCAYSNVFGAPDTGAHRHRVGGFAIVDILATGAAAMLLTRFAFGRKDLLALTLVFIILMLAAILIHGAFCVNTRLNSILFGRRWYSHKQTPNVFNRYSSNHSG
jgi:hypothetical protein